MKLYRAVVRLAGSVQHEVAKENLTGAEIIMIQQTHGDDAVVQVEECGDVKRASSEEHDRLCSIYDKQDQPSRVAKVFGQQFACNLPEEAMTVHNIKKSNGRRSAA